ncbi:hypothetical protein THRCLA_21726 [Thraustotheca clavata]|uniref:Uncharacterized protein n=1 Tax=Thraustotheca clavata TaxID=74557 RepID=A0A1V9ZQ87_9STRA|nr:hypothetical protein THRCLA_21726 [Thraustotheca clavata]
MKYYPLTNLNITDSQQVSIKNMVLRSSLTTLYYDHAKVEIYEFFTNITSLDLTIGKVTPWPGVIDLYVVLIGLKYIKLIHKTRVLEGSKLVSIHQNLPTTITQLYVSQRQNEDIIVILPEQRTQKYHDFVLLLFHKYSENTNIYNNSVESITNRDWRSLTFLYPIYKLWATTHANICSQLEFLCVYDSYLNLNLELE